MENEVSEKSLILTMSLNIHTDNRRLPNVCVQSSMLKKFQI